jgi:hypothetical protein
MLLGLHKDAEDEVPVVPLRILVDRAVVRPVLAVVETLRAARGERGAGQVDPRPCAQMLPFYLAAALGRKRPFYVFPAQLRTKYPAAKWTLGGVALILDIGFNL